MKPGLILQHGPTSPPGLFGEWAELRGIPVEVHQTFADPEAPHEGGANAAMPEIDDRPFVCCLGSKHSPLDRDVPVVAATIELTAQAVERDVPVLGLCYGGQVLSDVLGGVVEPARSAVGVQAFTSGPHLGTQFHPESTIEIVKHWASSDHDRLVSLGITDAEQQLEAGRAGAETARTNAFRLFDVFWERAQRADRRDP
jgi:GMP synthase-like glutamine amidotransferase